MQYQKFYIKKCQKLCTFFGHEVILTILFLAFENDQKLSVTEIGKESGFYITKKHSHMLVQNLLYELEAKKKVKKIQILSKNKWKTKWEITASEYQQRKELH